MSLTTSTIRAARRTESRPRSPDCAPADFDASSHPILAQHWFGIPPLCPIGTIAAEAISGLKLPHRIEPVRQPGLSVFGAAQPVAGSGAGS